MSTSTPEYHSPYISFSLPQTPEEDDTTNVVQKWLNFKSPSSSFDDTITRNLIEELMDNDKENKNTNDETNQESQTSTRKRCRDCLYLYKSNRTLKQHLDNGTCAKRIKLVSSLGILTYINSIINKYKLYIT